MSAGPRTEYRLILAAGLTTILAAALGVIADLNLLYTPDGGYETGDYAFMAGISRKRMLWGHYLGVLAIPLEAAGVWLVYKALRPAGRMTQIAAAVLGVYIIFPGVVFHGTMYPLPEAARQGPEALGPLLAFGEPLAAVFAAGFFLLMAGLTVLILRGKTFFPKWMALLTPLATYPVWVLTYLLAPAAGNYLLPAGFNLSMIVFFSAILLNARRIYFTTSPAPR